MKPQPATRVPEVSTVVTEALSQPDPFIHQRISAYASNRLENYDNILYALKMFNSTNDAIFSDKLYMPKRPISAPEGFPKIPLNLYNNKITGMPLDIAFFIFAMKQNEYAQYLAARTLQQNV